MTRLNVLLMVLSTTLTGCATIDAPRAMTLGRALAPEPTVVQSAVLTVRETGTRTVIHANAQSE